jgi:hypothetical protein
MTPGATCALSSAVPEESIMSDLTYRSKREEKNQAVLDEFGRKVADYVEKKLKHPTEMTDADHEEYSLAIRFLVKNLKGMSADEKYDAGDCVIADLIDNLDLTHSAIKQS